MNTTPFESQQRAPLRPYVDIDVRLLDILPDEWVQDVMAAVEAQARRVVHNLPSSTSRQGWTGLDYRVVDGNTVRTVLPWLWVLYQHDLRQLVERAVGQRVRVAQDVRSAVNINVLDSDSRYDWHVDSNSLTGLLFVTTSEPGAGGELLFALGGGREQQILPSCGRLLVFDGRDVLHTVRPPLSRYGPRISIPMNYYLHHDLEQRPDDLDRFLYGASVLHVDE